MFESYNNHLPSTSLDDPPAQGKSESRLLGLVPTPGVIPRLFHTLHNQRDQYSVFTMTMKYGCA